jgi:prepilin-type N-terminal cleavage/methylation domain-containing protein
METKRKQGFTIVELLTVMAIIAILMGLLLPAMNAVRKLAKDTSQRAQFKSIEAALEAYNNENGSYPDSSVSTSGSPYTVGAHKLCEALVGRDLLGFDTKSSMDAYADQTRTDSKEVYATLDRSGTQQAEVDASLKRRQPTYLKVDDVEAFQVGQLFNNPNPVYPGNIDYTGTKDTTTRISAPVLTDVYKAKKVTLPNGSTAMAGTPILYYKANTNSIKFPDTAGITSSTNDNMPGTYQATVTDANQQGFIYNILDNDDLVSLGQMMKPTERHHYNANYTENVIVGATTLNANGVWLFYNAITNQKMTNQVRPYNADKYILISAGHDGIYGTKDDICNFEN